VFAELEAIAGGARRLLRTSAAKMIIFRVVLYFVMLSAVAARERLHTAFRGAHSR